MVRGGKALHHCALHLQIGQNSCPLHQSSFPQQIPKCLIKLNHIHSSPPGIDTHWQPPCTSEEAAINGLPSFSPLFPPPALSIPCNSQPYSHRRVSAPPLQAFCRKSELPALCARPEALLSPLPFDHLCASSSRSATHSLALPPAHPQPLPSGDDLFVYLDSKLSRAGTVSNCMFVPYLQLCWTEYTHCHLLLETQFLLGVSSTEK